MSRLVVLILLFATLAAFSTSLANSPVRNSEQGIGATKQLATAIDRELRRCFAILNIPRRVKLLSLTRKVDAAQVVPMVGVLGKADYQVRVGRTPITGKETILRIVDVYSVRDAVRAIIQITWSGRKGYKVQLTMKGAAINRKVLARI